MATQADPSSHEPILENHRGFSPLLKRFLGRSHGSLPPESSIEASQAPPSDVSGDEGTGSRTSARRVVTGLPRAKTFKRQQSELREKLELNKPTQAERRAVSMDRRGIHPLRNASANRSQQFPRASAPELFDDAGSTTTARNDHSATHSPVEEKQFLNVPDITYHVDSTAAETAPSTVQFPSGEPSAADARSVTTSAYNTQIRDELENKWILNLSMHFRDKSRREKFFVTYRENEFSWRRVTISLDYRNAPFDSLEGDLQDTKFQREKSAKIYEAISESLQDIQFYDTVTNLKLQTTNGRLHVHVVEDVNEIIHFPAVRMVQHLGCRRVRERDIVFDSHRSGFVYKVQVDGRTLIKKEIPGPDTIEEFLYEVNALNSLKFSANTISFYGVVVDNEDGHVKGLLIDFAEKGALIDIIYDAQEHGPDLPWTMREKWARQIVQGLSDIHEAGFVQGDFTLSNIVIDEDDDAKIIDINRRGCPVGWEPPEATILISNNQRISMYIGVKSDLYQLGMVLWALAMLEDEPEARRRPLRLDPDIDVPRWYRRLVDICLNDNPRMRKQATALLDMFPDPAYDDYNKKYGPSTISVDDGRSVHQYYRVENLGDGHPVIRTVTPQNDAFSPGRGYGSGLTSPGLSGDAFYYPPRGRSPPSPLPSNLNDYDSSLPRRNSSWLERRVPDEAEQNKNVIPRVVDDTRMSEITRQLEGSLKTIGSQSGPVSIDDHGSAREKTQSIDLEGPYPPVTAPQIVINEVIDKHTRNAARKVPAPVSTVPDEDTTSTNTPGGSQAADSTSIGVLRQTKHGKEREAPLLHQEHNTHDDNDAANYTHGESTTFPPPISQERPATLQFPASDRPVYDTAADLTGIGTGYETEDFRKSICSDEDLGIGPSTRTIDLIHRSTSYLSDRVSRALSSARSTSILADNMSEDGSLGENPQCDADASDLDEVNISEEIISPSVPHLESTENDPFKIDPAKFSIIPFYEDEDIFSSTPTGTVYRVLIQPKHLVQGDSISGVTAGSVGKSQRQPTFALKRFESTDENSFKREVDALQQFSRRSEHSLLKLVGTFERDGAFFTITDWAEGGNLRDFWRANTQKPEKTFDDDQYWLMRQCWALAEGLASLHDRHRYTDRGSEPPESSERRYGCHMDLKPENILIFVSDNDGLGNMKIADFGLTQFCPSIEKERVGKTIKLTPTYRPPEVDLQDGMISRSYDIWSLGCVFLEMMVWLIHGGQAVEEFALERLRESDTQGLDAVDDYFTFIPRNIGSQTQQVITIKRAVKERIRRLHLNEKRSDIIHEMLHIIEHQMLVIAPDKRINSDTLATKLRKMRVRFFDGPDFRGSSQEHSSNAEMHGACRNQTSEVKVNAANGSNPAVKNQDERASRVRIINHDPGATYSVLDVCRHWLERTLNCGIIDWRPLPPVTRLPGKGQVKLVWKYGNQELSTILSEDVVWNSSVPAIVVADSPYELPQWTEGARSMLQSSLPRNGETARSHWAHRFVPSWIATAVQRSRRDKETVISAPVDTQPPEDTAPTTWKEAYVSIDKLWMGLSQTSLVTVPLDGLVDDQQFFLRTNEALYQAQYSRLKRFFSWKSFNHVELTKFIFLFNNSDFVSTFSLQNCGVAKELFCKGYSYQLCEDLDSDTGRLSLEAHMHFIGENIRAGLLKPDLGAGLTTVLDGMPKRMAPPLLERRAKRSGWAFHVGRALCLWRIASWCNAIIILGIVFVPYWLAAIDDLDLQNAFAPVTFLGLLITVWLAIAAMGNFK